MSSREQAAQRFEQLGWPTTQWEEWRYTNVAPIAKTAGTFTLPAGTHVRVQASGAPPELVITDDGTWGYTWPPMVH